ncbi:ABC transporter ATP-binding protein [Anaerobacillus alkaliphilus]|uniref:ABC transporter ATP-binding protein n=1 Tax=Anaerobacillus alkaliphilus TaxID=1548597 RepID=A0A4Q0VP07_9BACI|nr:ABC transporter ATP-binding protein [Anaerobacillus alkaliphilus]RXI97761.1 ABC transporter ATP-binding protein [Anaerobacillus alkaliphilus]
MSYIELTDVAKTMKDKNVIQELSFRIREGETFGLLGPNGAGKTTLLSMMSANQLPTSGRITVGQYDTAMDQKKIKSIVGIVPQDISLYSSLNAYDNLRFFASLYGMKKRDIQKRMEWLLDLVQLTDRAHEPISQYSGGMKRRINIAVALMHDPHIVYMDEPTVGIDPQSRNKIYELIEELKALGKTIIYTTHYMEEATNLCDRVAILDQGEVVALNETMELLKIVQSGIVELTMTSENASEMAFKTLKQLMCITSCQVNGKKLTLVVSIKVQDAISKIMAALNQQSLPMEDVKIMQPNLETVFLYLTGKTLRD